MPRTRTISLTVAAALTAVALGGCGQGSRPGSPSVRSLPVPAGARVVAHARTCDGGAHPYCAAELVVSAPVARYASSEALLAAERLHLQAAGWGAGAGDTVAELAAESPGHRERITYATAADDLESIDEATITRTPAIARALATQMFERRSALSVMVQAGSS